MMNFDIAHTIPAISNGLLIMKSEKSNFNDFIAG